MAKELAFNLEKLEEYAKNIQSISEELQDLEETVNSEMVTLKSGWNTPSGRAFFEKQDLEWAKEIKHYIAILNTLQGMIEYAHRQYSEVVIEAEKLTIYP